jgi:hypothetical protein
MRNAPTVNEQPGSANRLKNIFDESLAILCEGGGAPTVRRSSIPLHIDAISLQKRALSDAASALAALWKISKPTSSKLHSAIPCRQVS